MKLNVHQYSLAFKIINIFKPILKYFFIFILFFNNNLSFAGFDKENFHGFYLNTGVRNKPDAFYLSIGGTYFITNNFATRGGLMLMKSDSEKYDFWGFELGTRLYYGSRITPFIGIGMAYGDEEMVLSIQYHNEGDGWSTDVYFESDDEPVYYDNEGVQRSSEEKESDWMVTVYPEIGIEYFPSDEVSISWSVKYHITNGLTDNFWMSHICLTYYYF